MGLIGKSASSAMVGLDIGSELIKVAEARLARDGIQITGLGISPTPAGTVDNSIAVDPQALGAAIKQLLRDSGIKARQVVSSVSGQSSVVVRVIEVPKMTREELAETMKWEVERHVPFAPTEIVMDFAPIEKPNTPPDAQNMEVLLAVAQQDAINSHVRTLLAAGLEPVAIDVQPLAVSRSLINVVDGAQPQTVAAINIGATTTDFGIFEAGLLTFPGPPIPIAGINFTRAISEGLGVSMEEAERLKKEYAAADMSAAGGGPSDTAYDIGAPPAAVEPASFDTSVPQAGSDFSPFDFGGAPPPPPPKKEEALNISGEEVFDLGGGQEVRDFKPEFDLDEPEPGAEQPAPGFDLETEGERGAGPAGPEHLPPPAAAAPEAEKAPVAAPADGQDVRRSVINAVAPVLMELATEIRRSLDYYSTRYQNRPEQIFLCGGTAKMHDLDKFLASELGIPAQVADPIANLIVDCPKYSPQYLSEVSPLFPVSIGLAIREMLE